MYNSKIVKFRNLRQISVLFLKNIGCSNIVGSVQSGKPWTQDRLDGLEADLQHRFQCLLKHGGMGKRDETKRRRNGQ